MKKQYFTSVALALCIANSTVLGNELKNDIRGGGQ